MTPGHRPLRPCGQRPAGACRRPGPTGTVRRTRPLAAGGSAAPGRPAPMCCSRASRCKCAMGAAPTAGMASMGAAASTRHVPAVTRALRAVGLSHVPGARSYHSHCSLPPALPCTTPQALVQLRRQHNCDARRPHVLLLVHRSVHRVLRPSSDVVRIRSRHRVGCVASITGLRHAAHEPRTRLAGHNGWSPSW